MIVDNTLYHPEEVGGYQDRQEAQVAACRGFYTEVCPVSFVDEDEVFKLEDKAEVVVRQQDVDAISDWLRDAKTWLAFKPALIEDERGIVLILS